MPAEQTLREPPGAMGPDDAAQIARLFELSNDLLATASAEGYFTRLNPAWERVLGWTRAELMSRPIFEFVHPDDLPATRQLGAASRRDQVQNFENRYRCKDGSWRWLLWSGCSDGDTWYAVAKDVTARKELERRALHDPLTELPNRLLFMDRLEQALVRLGRADSLLAVLFLDLDRFKLVNDGFGHEVGDRVLVGTAERLRAVVRDTDTLARLGGDEFVVLAEGLSGPTEALLLAERVTDALAREFRVRGERVRLGASVGIATATSSVRSAEELLREADVAMYRVKSRGGDGAALFDEPMRVAVHDRMSLETDLRRAVEHDELHVVYQPLVSLRDDAVVGCEALVRWSDARRGLLQPASFVPLAEETGLIVPLGDYVLREACRQAVAWRRDGRALGVAVNVSPRQLARADSVDSFARVLEATGAPAEMLCLEVTETALAPDPQRFARNLAALKELGLRIAIDDFGRGFSSLSYLKSLPLDVLKIDRSFVAGLATSRDDRAIVAAVLSLAAELDLPVVAEGVESEWQHRELRRLGCDFAQGFLYARPERAQDLDLDLFVAHGQPGVGQPFGVHELMRQLGIPPRVEP